MKRFLSAFISGIMILSLLPASAAGTTETVEDVSNGVKAPVFNASNYNDDNLFKKYIRNAYSGKLSPTSLTLSSGALFKLVGRYNSAYRYSTGFNEKDDSMSMLWNTRYYRRNSGERWEANFKFKMATETSDQASYKNFKEMLNSGQIQMKFGGNFANNGNSRPSMKFGSNGIDGSSLPNNATVEKDSGWFNVSYNDLMYTELKMGGGGDGSETYINRPWVMFADLTKPTIKSASIGAGTLKLDMGEPLRVIGNISDMKLKLRATNLQTGIQDIALTATAERITNGHSNSIDFKIDAPDDLKEYQVTRIEGFEVSGQNYTGRMYGVSLADNYLFSTYYGEAKYKKINNQPGLIPENFTSSTPVTDIAGNNLEISRKDLTSFNLINDEVPPKVVSAEISGSMITEDNTKISQGSSWPEDIDRSSVFAGVGDSITFSLMSDEVLKIYNESEIYIDLNIKGKDGKPIRLSYDKTENIYDGVNKRKATKITFKPLTITADMTSDNVNDPIRPTKIEVNRVYDLYISSMKSTDIDFMPKQQIYFDNTAPTVEIDGNITGDADSGEFVVPIKLNDGEGTVSGFVGLDADFAWVYDGDKQISYKYAISTSLASPPAESDYKTAVLSKSSNPAWNKFETPQSEFYIHIKTDATELKDTKLMLKSNDWAGNSGTSEQSLDKISIDKVAPVISLVSMNTEYGDGSATIKAKVKVTDYNTDGLVAKYQLVDKAANPNDSKWESANITDGVFDFSQELTSAQKFEKDLLVYAADKKGNASDISRYSAVADLTKAKAKYEVKSDLSQLNSSPEIIVSAPDNPDLKQYADTRVTLKMGENYYTKVYNSKNAESGVNIFDFSGQSGWYKVTYNQDGTAFESVTEVDDMTKLSGFYGEVTVEFESAFSDLTPENNKPLRPTDNEEQVSYQKEGGFKVLYAPITDKLHDISFDNSFKTDKGETLTADGSVKHITRLKTMSDIRLGFNLRNTKVLGWGVNNIDFENSRIEVTNSSNDTVYTAPLSRSENQIFAMPDRDNDGNILGTDAYRITVYLYQTGSDEPQTFSYDTAVVLDNLTPSSNTGATKTEILPGTFFNGYAIGSPYITPIEKTSDTPMATINVGTADKAEIFRSETDAYAVNSLGMFYTKITLTTENVSKELCGETIGRVSGFRVWNKLTSGGEDLPFKSDKENSYSRTYDIRKIEDEANLKNAKADGDLKIIKGTNTICYQVKLDNGNISPVYEFTINTVDSLPQASLNMKINESKNYEDGSTIHALSADASLENVFSPNGDVKVYYLYQGGSSNNFAHWSCREIKANEETNTYDITNLIGESGKKYQSYTDVNDTGFKNTMHAFCIVDESGNSIVIFPQFKNGTKYTFEKETLNSAPYSLNKYNTSEYIYHINDQYTDLDKSTIIINDSGEELPLKNPPIPNPYGYTGASNNSGKLSLYFTKPWDAEKAAANEDFVYKLKVKRVGIHGDTIIEERSVDGENTSQIDGLKYVAPEYIIYSADEKGTSIAFNGNIKLKGEDSYLDGSIRKYPIFSDGTYNFEVTDVFGKTHTVPVIVNEWGDGPNVTVTPLENTRGNVTLIAKSDNYNISLAEKDGNSAATISDNDSKTVTAVIKQPTELTMTWNDGSGAKSRTMIINNNEVKPISPKIVWDYSEGDITDGCVYESVTATLVDDNGSTLIDPITGGAPSHTFYPDGETEFTFKPQSYTNQYGDIASEDVTAELAVKVIDYPAPKEWKDTTAPSVGIVGYVVRGDVAQSKNIILSVYNPEKQLANPALPEYTYNDSGTEKAYEKVESPEIFLQKMGWASKYRFNVNIGDESAVKLILKNGVPASAPDYNSVSDAIDGVSQSGRAIDVSKNASFTVYAIDSFGNITSVYMNIDNVGNAPVPHLEKVVSGDSQKIKVYLVPPADGGLTELKITNEGAIPETEGDYKGLYYIELSDNAKDLVVKYSCKYNGEELTGQLSTSVTEIDKSNPKKTEEKWSENVHSIKTNKDVTVQMRFDKTITDAKLIGDLSNVEIFRLDNQVTVSYSENSPALTIECTAVNGQKCEVKLNEVKNIDKVKPNITVTKTELSKYKRKATITLTADETVAFLEGGESGTEFTREVSANGTYRYNFTDLAGNKTEITVKVSDIITGDLSLMFSLNSDGSNSQPTPDKLGGLNVGDKVYVKPSRDCTITFGKDITAKESEWTELTVTEDKAGLYPTLKATDDYGNTKYYHFLQIALPDKTPPTIKLKAETIDISLSLSDDEIKSKLTENAIVSDDTSKNDKISLSFAYEKPKAAATVNVTYKAEDEAKNTAHRTGKIHFYQNNELLVKVNDVSTYRDMVVISAKEPQNIVVSSGGEPYSVYVKNGIKTVGQMKIGSTKLAYNKTDDTAVVFTPDKAGYYTFLVKTQGQDSYRFVIYVK